jgi:alkylation response protein AidB-like acyl-CoA dehydrogenase
MSINSQDSTTDIKLNTKKRLSEEESRQVAEDARQDSWTSESFIKEIFGGSFDLNILKSVPTAKPFSEDFQRFYSQMKTFLETEIDSNRIDREGQYPPEAIKKLAEMGAMGMKIPKKYGGLGFTLSEYGKIMELLGSQDSNLLALLSAHQSIGIPNPLMHFGTEAQKEKYLPRVARGMITAFALTESEVGSDPANLSTTLTRTAEGDFVLNGEKLWCTNGTIAGLYVVMARHNDTKKISAVIVERDWPGVEVVTRCHFMGMRALENGIIRFTNVHVPKENLLWKEGKGLKLALVTLNTGRLSIPNGVVGGGRRLTQIVRAWGAKRYQWGNVIGKHEAVGHMIADIATTSFAIESMAYLCNRMADDGTRDIRLEAAVAKLWTTEEGWKMVDTTLQVRGGRGFETADSLINRGEAGVGIERMLRDFRINLIFEGSSEIMHLFIAREALDKHLSKAWDLVNPKGSWSTKIKAIPKVVIFYAWWYPSRWWGLATFFKYHSYGSLGKYLRQSERYARKLSRAIFHQMVLHGPKLEKKQATLFRAVDISADLFALSATIIHANDQIKSKVSNAEAQARLANLFSRKMIRRIQTKFNDLDSNEDIQKTNLSREILEGKYKFMEDGVTRDKEIEFMEFGRP